MDADNYKVEDFSRKWYARYATNDEKVTGKGPSLSRIQELYEKARIIWAAEAEKNKMLKEAILKKLQ